METQMSTAQTLVLVIGWAVVIPGFIWWVRGNI